MCIHGPATVVMFGDRVTNQASAANLPVTTLIGFAGHADVRVAPVAGFGVAGHLIAGASFLSRVQVSEDSAAVIRGFQHGHLATLIPLRFAVHVSAAAAALWALQHWLL